jgi:cytidylate kinase
LSPHDLNRDGLRTAKVGQGASKIAAIPKVRAAMIDFQQKFARQEGGAVLDGRDIGTVICPAAEIQLFVTASDEVRAARRFAEISQKNEEATLASVLEDLRQRDQRDRDRASAPLKQADGAVLLDTSDLDVSETLAQAIAIVGAHPALAGRG